MKKKFLKITGIMVLFMVLVGFWGYNKYIAPDQKIQQQLNNQFGPEFFNSFDDKAVSNSGTGDNSGAVNNPKSNDDLVKTIDIPMPDSVLTTPSPPANKNVVVKQITQDEINNKYKPQFSHLQSVALSRLNSLYSAAIQEYVQSRKAGTLNRSVLAQKYIQAGTMLETSMDNQFYSTLNLMETELIANNFPTDLAGIYKTEYEKAKSNRRSQLLAKALK